MAETSALIERFKFGLISAAVVLFVVGIVINWLGIPLRLPALALTSRNSGVIELSYLLAIFYFVLRTATGRFSV